MNEELSGGFRIKEWEIWPLRDLLIGPDGEHHIEPKAMQVLVALASHPEQVVTRENLLDEIWPDTYSGEVSLTRCVSQLRSSFSEERGNSEFIETIPKIGYRLVAPVEPYAAEKPQDQPKTLNWVTVAIAVLFLGLGYLVIDRFVLEPARHTVTVKAFVPPENSIAVLPFDNVSDDPGNDHFSEGISDDVRNLLTKVPEMQVTSRQSTEIVAEQDLDIATMAGKLNVAHFLEGSVRKFGNELRITAQLIEVETDTYIWSEVYNRTLEDVFLIQDEIAAAVVNALKITLLGTQLKTAETNPEAYTLYLQGRHFIKQGNAEASIQAEAFLLKALEIDPNFAPAWTDMARVYRQQADPWGVRPIDEGDELARQAIHEALTIDPQLGSAHAVLSRLVMAVDWDIEAGYRHMQRALELSPGEPQIMIGAAITEYTLGRVNEAIDLLRQAITIDPLNSWAYFNLGYALYTAHRLDEAAEALHTARSLSQGGDMAHFLLGLVLLEQGDAPAALMAMEQTSNDSFRALGMAFVWYELGDTEASNAALNEFIECCIAGSSYNVAVVYAFRGEIDMAFEWLERAYDKREDTLLILVLTDPQLVILHDDPRWTSLLDKMGLPHE